MEQELSAIKQELGLFQLNQLKRDSDTKARIDGLEAALSAEVKRSNDLEVRIKTLETARQAQIALNSQFQKKSEVYQPPVNSQPTKSWFKWK